VQAIEAHYEMIRQILASYGVLMTRREVREGLERLLRNEPSDGPEECSRATCRSGSCAWPEMELRGPLVVLAALLVASAGSAEEPSQPAPPKRLGRPVLQPPGAEEQPTGPPGAGHEPGGAERAGSRRLGRPVLRVPPRGVRGATEREAPAHSASDPRRPPAGQRD